MRAIFPNPMRQLIAGMLAMCLSMCCCHAAFLGGGMAEGEGGMQAAAGCCSNCASETPQDRDRSEDDAPETSCQICCIKGTGEKDRPALDVPVDLGTSLGLPATEVAWMVITPLASATPLPPPPVVLPPTLLQLFCSLLV